MPRDKAEWAPRRFPHHFSWIRLAAIRAGIPIATKSYSNMDRSVGTLQVPKHRNPRILLVSGISVNLRSPCAGDSIFRIYGRWDAPRINAVTSGFTHGGETRRLRVRL